MLCHCQKKAYVVIAIILLAIVGLACWWRISHLATAASLEKRISRIDQDPVHYADKAQPVLNVSPIEEAQLTKTFLGLYFAPWNQFDNVDLTNILTKIQGDIATYTQNPSWEFSRNPFSSKRLNNIIADGDLTGFPQINRSAIIVHTAQVRIFPTLLPGYNNPRLAGEGYPFDNWIATYVFQGLPVRILQLSKDKLWYLIAAASFYGWIPVDDVAFVNSEFITEWTKHNFIVPLRDNVPVYNDKNTVISKLRVGVIYPTTTLQSQTSSVLMPMRDANGEAQMMTVLVNNADIHSFPIPANPQNVASVARNFIGGQYGWGDLYELRDCSATTSDILAGFAIWLPRNSSLQVKMGKVISLAGMTSRDKIKILSQQGIPFFTLVHFPGHIALYIGTYDGKPYILQDVWGLHTVDILSRNGRAVIGKTIINDLDFTRGFSNRKETQLDTADSISILTPDTYSDEHMIRETVGE